MGDRIDRSGANREVNRAQQVRAREVQKKQTTTEFLQKLTSGPQVSESGAEQATSKQVLEQYAKGQETSKGVAAQKSSAGAASKKVVPQKSQKTENKKTQKDTEKDKNIEKKNEKVVLDLAVQRKNQQDKDSGEFGGSSKGDFFQQAVSMGMATQKAEVVPTGPVKIPEEIFNQIVDKVFAGVDPEGVSLFVIDLKQGVLGGGRIQISAQGKAVKLKFSGLDAVSRQSVKSARRELSDRLGAKGLELEALEMA